MKKKITILLLILFLTLAFATSYFLNINNLQFEDIKIYIGDNLSTIGISFLIIYALRIYIFIPATVIIIGLGIISQNILFTFIISITGITIGLTETYLIGIFLDKGLNGNKLLKNVIPHIEQIKKKGFIYILIGCFFPLFPTDVVCYASGFMKYDFRKFLIAGLLGELPLTFLYSYLGINAEKYIIPIGISGGILIIIYFIYINYKKSKKTLI